MARNEMDDGVMKRIATIWCLALLAASCGGDGSVDAAADGPAQTSSSASATDPASTQVSTSALPNGSYEHTATLAEALDAGFSRKEVAEAFGGDGKLPITFTFEDGSWQHIVVLDDGTREVGDNGTYTVDGNKLVTTSESDGCFGCIVTYRWTLDGNMLSLTVLSDSAGEEDARDVRLNTQYEFEMASTT
jgi:hypothetical protein